MNVGRKSKPTQTKKLEGNPGKRPLNDNEPVPSQGLPVPPDWLGSDEVEHFYRLVEILDPMQLASESHVDMLTMLCYRLGQIEELTQYIAEEGMSYITTTKQGDIMHRSRPEVAQLNESLRHAQSLLSEFGLSPSSMSKVSLPSTFKLDNPWEQFTVQ